MAKISSKRLKQPVRLPDPQVPRIAALPRPSWTEREDVRLFALTFVGGFVFTSLFIA